MFISSAHAETPTPTATESATPTDAGGHTTAEGAAGSEATHTGTEGGHGPRDYPGTFPPFDPATFSSQILWLAITFGLFYFLINRVIVPRISSILEVRRDRISQDLDEANRLKEDSDTAHAAYEHELANAKSKAQAIAAEAGSKSQADADAKRHAAEESLADKLAESEKAITAIKEKAMAEVGGIAQDTVGDIVQSLAGIKASKDEIAKALSAVAKEI